MSGSNNRNGAGGGLPADRSILDAIGNTPLVRLGRVVSGVKPRIYAKLENMNPGGSMKDRIALGMVEAAERSGALKPGGTIVECTSGNTGAGLAQIAAAKGYKAIFTIPDKMSSEKVNHLKALGAEVVVTPTVPHDDPASYQSVAKRITENTPGAVLMDQYHNPANVEAHHATTGREIWEQTGGRIDCFVASTGTGGTISGVGRYLKEQDSGVRVVGVDPVGSALAGYYADGKPGEVKPYKLEGAGMDELPGTMLFEYVDEMVRVDDKAAFRMTRLLARQEGIFAGGSSGMVLQGALEVARGMEEGQVVVALFPDTGYKYLSKIYDDAWMLDNGYADSSTISVRTLLTHKAISVPELLVADPSDTVRSALNRMLDFNISQMPVVRDGAQIGGLEEHRLMAKVLEDHAAMEQPVEGSMGSAFPVVEQDHSLEQVRTYIARDRVPAVLVSGGGSKLIGIITKSDLLGLLN